MEQRLAAMDEGRAQPARWLRRCGYLLLTIPVILGLGALACRAAIGWIFPVGSESMEPTIMTGESVFLRYGKMIDRRFDVVAFQDPGGGASIKRVAGLPSEKVMVTPSGDLRIDDKFIPNAPGRPAPVLIFDSKQQKIDEHWRHGATAFDPWTIEPGRQSGESEVFTLDGNLVPLDSDAGLLRFQDRITDGQLTLEGRYQPGSNVVHDVIVEFEVKVISAGGIIRVQVSEEDDWFAAYIPVYDGDEASKTLIKRNRPSRVGAPPPGKYFGDLSAKIPSGEWVSIRLSNIDNQVSLRIGDATFTSSYRENTPRLNPMTLDDAPFSSGERVKVGGAGVVLQLRNLAVLRDFYVLPRGKFGVGRNITLGPREFFVLGDNTLNSRDSRDRGPISMDRFIGTAKAVVRPLRAFRRL
jgi:signal peptidase I